MRAYPTPFSAKWLKWSVTKLSDKSLWRRWETAFGGTKGAETALTAALGPPELRNEALSELSDSFSTSFG
jgi:hypothetical protein